MVRTDPEQAYTAGLLANIGLMVLERHMDDARFAIRAVAQSGVAMIEAEKRTLGMHHAEVGARLATRWGLPEILVDTIRNHHTMARATVDPRLTGTAHIADILTNRFHGGGVRSRASGGCPAMNSSTSWIPWPSMRRGIREGDFQDISGLARD